ncbi:MAG: hypothetical protein Q4G33_11845 [bacterium]|nr:hypothetical protein [bacterium]
MGYWIFLLCVVLLLIGVIVFAWYSKVKDNDEEQFVLCIGCICVLAFFVIYFGLDIPSALSGGQEVYVDKFPDIASMRYFQLIEVDGVNFLSFSGFNSDKYEQDAAYCIRYTKLTRTILSIEQIENEGE